MGRQEAHTVRVGLPCFLRAKSSMPPAPWWWVQVAVAAQAQTLKLGVVGGMTGPGAPWGLAIDGGVKVAAEEVNQAGGLAVNGKKYKVEVVTYDDHYKAADAVTAVRTVWSIRVVLTVLPSCSTVDAPQAHSWKASKTFSS